MFNEGTPFTVDDFRDKLKAYVDWTETKKGTTLSDDRLQSLSSVLGTPAETIRQWIIGRARPSITEERSLLSVLGTMVCNKTRIENK